MSNRRLCQSRHCNFIVVLSLGAFLLPSTAWARFTLDQVMSFPFAEQLVSAKSGERIAWVFNIRGVRNVWVADGPGFKARQVTHYTDDDGQPIASLRLTPDGSTIVYARGSETNEAGEVADPNNSTTKPKQQVWAAPVDTGQPRLLGDMECTFEGCEDIEISFDGRNAVWAARHQLWIAPLSGATPATPAQQLTYVRGDNLSPRWSPNNHQIAFVSSRGDHAFIAIYDFSKQNLQYIAPSVDRDDLPRWSPDGRQLAFVRVHGTERNEPVIPERPVPWSIWVAEPATGATRQIWRSGNTMADSLPELTEDVSFNFAADGRVVFASERDGWNHLYSIGASGDAVPVLLTPGNYEVKDVALSTDKRSVLYSANVPTTPEDVDRIHAWRVRVAGGAPQALSRGTTLEWTPIETGDAQQTVCLGSSATMPAMPYRLTAGAHQLIAAQALPASFPANQLVTPRQVIFKSADGFTIHGQLFVPPGRTGAGPALLFMHGGSMRQMILGFHYMEYYHNAYAENQYLANLGYVVLSVNYRTGIMYGRAFRQPPNAGWRGASEYQDIVAAGKYLQTLPIVDPRKIGLWGGSYGGFLTAMGLARNSDIFAAGVDLHGVHDWSAELGYWESRTNAPDKAAAEKLAWESSPDASVATWRSPVLLIQGDDDRNVSFSQTVDLAQRLRERQVGFEQMVFPDEIHDFLMWKSWVRAYGAAADFFDRVLKRGQTIAVN